MMLPLIVLHILADRILEVKSLDGALSGVYEILGGIPNTILPFIFLDRSCVGGDTEVSVTVLKGKVVNRVIGV